MKTIDIAKASKPLSDYAKRANRQGVIVLRNGKPIAVLSSARGMDAESIALANSPKFAKIIQKARARHEAEGGVSIEEIRRRFGLPVKPKRRSPR